MTHFLIKPSLSQGRIFSGRVFLFLIMAMAPMVSACSPLGMATGAGAATGVAAAREGGIKGSLSDIRINADISDRWFKYDVNTFSKLNITVNNGRVLLTGVVQEPKHRVEAVRLAWQPESVKQVINEIRIADSEGISGYIQDTWITAKLRTAMTFDKQVQSINYSIDTVQNIVYLMGAAHSEAERNRVKALARGVSGVRQVVSYIKLLEPAEGK